MKYASSSPFIRCFTPLGWNFQIAFLSESYLYLIIKCINCSFENFKFPTQQFCIRIYFVFQLLFIFTKRFNLGFYAPLSRFARLYNQLQGLNNDLDVFSDRPFEHLVSVRQSLNLCSSLVCIFSTSKISKEEVNNETCFFCI